MAKHEDLGLSDLVYIAFENEFQGITVEDKVKLFYNLLSKYDGSLDLFINVWLEYLNQNQTDTRADRKKGNDVFDLGHILYLKQDDMIYFVTAIPSPKLGR